MKTNFLASKVDRLDRFDMYSKYLGNCSTTLKVVVSTNHLLKSSSDNSKIHRSFLRTYIVHIIYQMYEAYFLLETESWMRFQVIIFLFHRWWYHLHRTLGRSLQNTDKLKDLIGIWLQIKSKLPNHQFVKKSICIISRVVLMKNVLAKVSSSVIITKLSIIPMSSWE